MGKVMRRDVLISTPTCIFWKSLPSIYGSFDSLGKGNGIDFGRMGFYR
jgi:hypothetical protein